MTSEGREAKVVLVLCQRHKPRDDGRLVVADDEIRIENPGAIPDVGDLVRFAGMAGYVIKREFFYIGTMGSGKECQVSVLLDEETKFSSLTGEYIRESFKTISDRVEGICDSLNTKSRKTIWEQIEELRLALKRIERGDR